MYVSCWHDSLIIIIFMSVVVLFLNVDNLCLLSLFFFSRLARGLPILFISRTSSLFH